MLLALERSTAHGSAALFSDDGKLLAEEYDEAGRGDAFSIVEAVVSKAGADISCVDAYAVGLGPGSFSGVRSAMSVLNGIAAPSGARITGVGSAVAAAFAYRSGRRGSLTDRVAVVGDARRGRIWMSVFGDGYGHCHDASGFALVPYAEAAKQIPGDAIVITPDWDRINVLLKEAVGSSRLHVGAFYPTASAVGQLAISGCCAVNAVPIYLNPAVLSVPVSGK